MTNKPTELVVTQAEQKAVEEWLTECTDGRVSDQTKLMLRLFSHWLHGRLAFTAPASEDAVNVVRAALRPRSEREEIANWLREDAPQWGHEALADAIERGDFKEGTLK